MEIVLITGSNGLIGSEAAEYFCQNGFRVIGIDNNLRQYFFGCKGSTLVQRQRLMEHFPESYQHYVCDIRDVEGLRNIFAEFGADIKMVIHTAAQPSHDWAQNEPLTDFGVNATGTLHMLEMTRLFAPKAVFVFTSTNKVYGDTPNALPLVETPTRWTIAPGHAYAMGIGEDMSIDRSMHSIFGASKVAADVMVQEYGRYFGLLTGVFRGGCLTGPRHAGTELHGFLSYLVKCAMTGEPYKVYGYKGKQVRDNIHSLDLIRAFHEFYKTPRTGEVYNIGGGLFSNCSIREAISLTEKISGRKMNWSLVESNRKGDHVWWVSDTRKFQSHFPGWKQHYQTGDIITQIVDALGMV